MSAPALDFTHDPDRRSWLDSANEPSTPFPLQNLPFAVFSAPGRTQRIGVAIGDALLDLSLLFGASWDGTVLNGITADQRRAVRADLSRLLASDSPQQGRVQEHLVPLQTCNFHLPFTVGDYTDFYASIDHASNVGRLFRPDNPLLPNYRWVPIAYHGRASSLVISGTEITRPCGQLPGPEGRPVFGPSKELDYELEVGIWMGGGNAPGQPVPVGAAQELIFGFCLVNDWSARDIQRWEYQPLGPFLSKNFATTVSPFVVTPEALAPFRTQARPRGGDEPRPLPYLFDAVDQERGALDIHLEARLNGVAICRSNPRDLYWTPAQMIAHHSSGGCALRSGDLIATGTVSGPDPEARGCLLERTRRGQDPIPMPDGTYRTFLEDGDEVSLSGVCRNDGYQPIGFGYCRGQVRQAN